MQKYIFLFVLFSSAFSVYDCMDEKNFNQNFSTWLKGASLTEHFQKGTFLGKGSFGKVVKIFLGTMPFAMKAIKKPFSKYQLKLIENELRFMEQMRDKKAVVEFYECVENDKYLFILQEVLYKDLENANLLLEYKSKNVETRIKIFTKILSKFSILHKEEIVHEDVKPKNIMSVDEELNDFRIIDLGLASHIGKEVQGGNPIFSGKEKVGSLPDKADPTHDIYALGLTFAVLESKSKVIFEGFKESCFKIHYSDDCYKTLMKNIENALERSGMGAMINVIKKATMKDYNERYRSVDLMIEDIEKILNEMGADKKSLIVKQDVEDLLESKIEAEKEPVEEIKYEKEKGYLKKDEFYKVNFNIFQRMFKIPVEEEKVMHQQKNAKFSYSPSDVVISNYIIVNALKNNYLKKKLEEQQEEFVSPNKKKVTLTIGPQNKSNLLKQLSPRKEEHNNQDNDSYKPLPLEPKSKAMINACKKNQEQFIKALNPDDFNNDGFDDYDLRPKKLPKTENYPFIQKKDQEIKLPKKHIRHFTQPELEGPGKDYEFLKENNQKNRLNLKKNYSVYELKPNEAKKVTKKDKEFPFHNEDYRNFWDKKNEVYGNQLINLRNTKREKSNPAKIFQKKETILGKFTYENEYEFKDRRKKVII